MHAQIRPNQLEISDRFPVLGFTVRTDEPGVRAEVAIATEPSLFLPDMKAKRTPSTFYSSRATGMLALPRGEAVYMVPPNVMARFVGQERLYVGLAVASERNGAVPEVAVMPSEGSPYISLKGLTGRSLKRVTILPRNSHRGASYGNNEIAALEWAGDTAKPGLKPTSNSTTGPATPSANGGTQSSPVIDKAKTGASATPVEYNDGFGPMPGKPENAPVHSVAGSATAQALSTRQGPALAHAQEIVTPFYDPVDPATALTCQNDAFSQAREEWFAGVPNTGIFPHSAICQLLISAPDGRGYQGTGFYIGRNRILTCAHNLYKMSSVTIIPGRNGAGSKPFGQQTVQSSSWRVAPNYSGDGDWNNDLAVIDNVPLEAPNGQWLQFLNATPSDRLPIVVCGYSAGSRAVPELTEAIDGDAQHLHGGYATGQSNFEVIEYPILTLMGASGSPVYNLSDRSGKLEALVCAVHVTGEPAAQGLNRGCFITPAKIDWIEGRTTAFSRAQDAPDALQIEITEIAGSSDLARYSWKDRGVAPSGYIKGMALVYARVYSKLKAGDAAALEMAKAKTEDSDRDALAWYDDIFAAVGMSNDSDGVDTLRHLFVLLIGLGMRESSGRYCEGRDKSAQNITAETAEAGLFQTSFNARRASSLLPTLFAQYSANPSGFLDVFQEGVHCSASNLENFGSGDGKEFQRLSKECPAFAAEFTAVGLRNVRRHWGPITRRGAEVRPECDTMLQQVEACIDAAALSSPFNASHAMATGDVAVNGGEVLMPAPPPPRARAMSGVGAAAAIGGFLLETVRDRSGGVTWELDQFANRKHPNDIAPENPPPCKDAATIKLDTWPVSGGALDDISAWFAIDWQYNGKSLGNVRIGNIGINDAVGWSLQVRAQVMDDNILYEPGGCAALHVLFHYRFSSGIVADNIAITDVHLYGDGTYETSSRWVQPNTLAQAQGDRALILWTSPLPASEAGRFASALAKLESLVVASIDPRNWRYLAWIKMLKEPNVDDRVIRWASICPAKSGAIGAAMPIGACDLESGGSVKQADLENTIQSIADVDTSGQSLGIITFVKSDIVVSVETTAFPLENLQALYNQVQLAIANLNQWANNESGGSSAMPSTYRSIAGWIGERQDDSKSVYSCMK